MKSDIAGVKQLLSSTGMNFSDSEIHSIFLPHTSIKDVYFTSDIRTKTFNFSGYGSISEQMFCSFIQNYSDFLAIG